MCKKTIVVSAVNLRIGGTLTILQDCLRYLSGLAGQGAYRIVALVYERSLADFPHIEYMETQWPKRYWVNRLWYEYVDMRKISKEIGSVYLWLSLHDTTPNVFAEKRAVYCHNPFPFYKWKRRELFFAPKIVLFSLFSKFIYQKGIHQNDYVIVQQQWLKDAFERLFGLKKEKIILALPQHPQPEALVGVSTSQNEKEVVFLYAASPNSHKNFECLCEATALLEQEGIANFKVYITLSGNENAYAKWLYRKWGKNLQSLCWIGFQSRKALFQYYAQSDCLVFPSKIETWGLPITEFAALNKPMFLADLAYAKETAAGSEQVAFFDPDQPIALAVLMKQFIAGDRSMLSPVPAIALEQPVSHSWEELFRTLLVAEDKGNGG